MSLLSKTFRYFTLKKEEKLLFHQALKLLISWKIRIVFLPMRNYVKLFGEKGKEATSIDVPDADEIYKFSFAIHRADSALPWRSKCLTEAIATKRLLARYNKKSTLFLGVAKDERQKLIAHAWLKYSQKIIMGEKGHQKFTVVEKFA